MAHIATRREIARRRTRYRVFAGMYDFVSTIAGAIALILAAILFFSLLSWVRTDGYDSFRSLIELFEKALIR